MDAIRKELLAHFKNGKLDVKQAHDWAKVNKKSALHQSLEWDDQKAGYAHRLHQLRHLVTLHIINEEREPEMVSLSIDRGRGGGYRKIVDVLDDKALTEIMLTDALSELNRVAARYRKVKELTSIWKEIDKATRKRKKLEAA